MNIGQLCAETEEHLKCLHDLLEEFKPLFQEKPEEDGDTYTSERSDGRSNGRAQANSLQIYLRRPQQSTK